MRSRVTVKSFNKCVVSFETIFMPVAYRGFNIGYDLKIKKIEQSSVWPA